MPPSSVTDSLPVDPVAPQPLRHDACPRCGGFGFLRRDVPLGHADFGRAIPCDCKIAELSEARLDDLRRASNLDALVHMTFERFVPDGYGLPPDQQRNLRAAYDTAYQYAADPRGWLILRGGYGCGKTHLAAAIAHFRIAHGKPALFVVVPDLLDHLRATYSPGSAVRYDERFEAVRTAPLLILDDLGAQSTTAWAQEKLFQIFNYRYNAQLPTVITTNCALEDIDERLRSRMVDPGLCHICTIKARDFRASGVGDSASELSTLALHSDQTFEHFDLRVYELDPEERENLRSAFNIARDYAAQPSGWLIFMGTYGCGKTHLAAAIANFQVAQGQPAMFVVVPDLLDHLRATFSPTSTISFDKRFDEVRNAPFLVLDDLGTESATPWAKEKLFQLINYRYDARLPTVFTTSRALEELDPRLATRMVDASRCTAYLIRAPSYRGELGDHRPAPGTRGRHVKRKA